jgi:hypothetical protein
MHWHGSRIGKDLPSNFNFCLKRMAKIRSACRYYNGGKVTAITAGDFSRAMLEALPVDWGWVEIGLPPVIHSCLGFSINHAFLDTPIYGNPHIIVKKTGYKPLRDFQVCLMCLWNPLSSTAVLDLIIVHANQREIQL